MSEPLETGAVVEGTITGITDFGAFVKLPTGDTGLVHISEIADEYVKDVRNFVSEEQTVRVKVLGLNKKGKYDLSLKQVDSDDTVTGPPPARAPRRPEKTEFESGEKDKDEFEDKLKKWRRESEERLLDVRRNTENKRGGGRYKR